LAPPIGYLRRDFAVVKHLAGDRLNIKNNGVESDISDLMHERDDLLFAVHAIEVRGSIDPKNAALQPPRTGRLLKQTHTIEIAIQHYAGKRWQRPAVFKALDRRRH